MKKGFTLIELLAVIVILAIIALIATPIILGIINDAREQSKKRSIEMYVKGVELAVARKNLEGEFHPTSCTVTNGIAVCDGVELAVDVDNSSNINGTITFNEKGIVTSNILTTKPIVAVSFEEDDWATISAVVKSGNYPYQVGDTKEVDMGDFGTHTLRVANTTPCDGTLQSETACGFVLEFADVITTHNMNSTNTNAGGWPASRMRTYVNNDIYNALPEKLRNVIIDTTVISGHGSTSGETNFTSTDKLYLLSTKEVWGKEGTTNVITRDTAETETRQLDYYANNGVTTSNRSGAKKKNGSTSDVWWLRSAGSSTNHRFFSVASSGDWNYGDSSTTNGVSSAFRIGA